MPPIDYKAPCVFASGLTLRTDTWLTDRPSAHPVHKLYADLLCPCCVHYSLCVANAQHETHISSCKEMSWATLGYSFVFSVCFCPGHAGYLQALLRLRLRLYLCIGVSSAAVWVQSSPRPGCQGRSNRLSCFGSCSELYCYVCGWWK